MICTQDLWAIKSMLEDFKDYCTCEEAVGNLINEVEKEIDERDNIQKADRYREALEEIEGYVKTTIRIPLERKLILDIINKAKEEK